MAKVLLSIATVLNQCSCVKLYQLLLPAAGLPASSCLTTCFQLWTTCCQLLDYTCFQLLDYQLPAAGVPASDCWTTCCQLLDYTCWQLLDYLLPAAGLPASSCCSTCFPLLDYQLPAAGLYLLPAVVIPAPAARLPASSCCSTCFQLLDYTCFQLLYAALHDPDIPLQLHVGPLHGVPGPRLHLQLLLEPLQLLLRQLLPSLHTHVMSKKL